MRSERPDGPPPVPRWVKGLGVVALLIALVAAIAFATGLAGDHGPWRHAPSEAPSAPAVGLPGPAAPGGDDPVARASQPLPAPGAAPAG